MFSYTCVCVRFLYLRREPMAPSTAAAGASAGTNRAATGRTRSATGRTRLMAGTSLFLRKFFGWGASELKSILLGGRVCWGQRGVIIHGYIIIIRELRYPNPSLKGAHNGISEAKTGGTHVPLKGVRGGRMSPPSTRTSAWT